MKVKIRIAVAIDSNGDWNCSGYKKPDGKSQEKHDNDMMDFASEMVNDGERRYWIEAEIDTPENTTIQANVLPS